MALSAGFIHCHLERLRGERYHESYLPPLVAKLKNDPKIIPCLLVAGSFIIYDPLLTIH